MNLTKQILVVLVCLLLHATAVAQEPLLAKPSRDTSSRDVTIIIQQQQLRFAAPITAQELRLEVFNQGGEIIYDSGPIAGAELSWALQNANGEAVSSGLYAYTLTVKDANSETPTLRRGHLILESGRDRLWVTSQGAIGAEAKMGSGELTVSTGPETNVAGAQIEKQQGGKSLPTVNLGGYGTSGQIPKFGGGDFLVNSVITEDFNGRIGIGTQSPTSPLTVAGRIETTSGGIKFPDGTVQLTSAAGALLQVSHDATLTGNGTSAMPLGLADSGVTGPKIANGAITGAKIASGQVVKSLNGLFDNVSLAAGANITVTPSGNSLNISAPNLLSSVAHNSTLVGNGTSASPLGVAVPLNLNGVAKAMISVRNDGTITSCYNGMTNSSSGNCGFIVTTPLGPFAGVYRINFGFSVANRFVSVTCEYNSSGSIDNSIKNVGGNYRYFDGTSIEVFTFNADDAKNTTPADFTIIVH